MDAFIEAIVIDPPASVVEERRRLGLDHGDEVWDGVIHLVPQPGTAHQMLATDLLIALAPIARSLGLECLYNLAVLDPVSGEKNYRRPDLVVFRREHVSERGIEGKAALVVEILSPDDETRDKMPFYAAVGVEEIWIIDPTRVCEVYVLRGTTYYAAFRGDDGAIRSPALGMTLRTVEGPRLQISWQGGAALL
jgi:Uma2 family endonuclease